VAVTVTVTGDLPPFAKNLLARGCTDVRDIYALEKIDRDYDATTLSVVSTLLGAGVTQVYNAPFLSFAIAGDADAMLTVIFVRAPSGVTTDLGSASEKQTVTARRGGD
jgi:NAD(P)H-hydrate repair Nnr-like enzyme with NAD(P)H-hydrate epimerase domain